MLHPWKSRQPDRAQALTVLLVNQLATPGLGSMLAGRYLAGAGQLSGAVAGFVLLGVWFARVLIIYYGLAGADGAVENPDLHHELWQIGAGLFGGAWLWALGTSLSLWRQAGEQARAALAQPGAPPVLDATRR